MRESHCPYEGIFYLDKTRYNEGVHERSKKKLCAGFTLVEAVVMIAVVTFMSALVLVSFTGLNEGGVLNRASREVALTLRSAQNMALAVRAVPTQAGPVTAPVVGVWIRAGELSTQTFADMGNPPDGKYVPLGEQGGADLDIQKYYLPRGTTIYELRGLQSQNPYPAAHVLFAAPEAKLTLTDENGADIGSELRIVVAPSDGSPQRTIIVKTNGQISIK